jgi:GT2 family glycosyltransferase
LNPVDIIIPVYRGFAETRACIESVLASKNKTPFDIIVFNDASPEPAIADYLAALAREEKITLLTNSQNLGFVATVNRAMALDSDNDLLLLNSDTLVSGDWLDRIVACAARDESIASVTPFSNNATICSYPTMGESAAMPDGEALHRLDQLFAHANAGQTVDIPTGVGFCMWMRRSAINAIGKFDESAFGRGYGEENDWCYRASATGRRHVLCADVFVAHRGEVSFGTESLDRKARAQAVIDARYPQYQSDIASFVMRDPARPFRYAVDIERLKASPLPRVLMVMNGMCEILRV